MGSNIQTKEIEIQKGLFFKRVKWGYKLNKVTSKISSESNERVSRVEREQWIFLNWKLNLKLNSRWDSLRAMVDFPYIYKHLGVLLGTKH